MTTIQQELNELERDIAQTLSEAQAKVQAERDARDALTRKTARIVELRRQQRLEVFDGHARDAQGVIEQQLTPALNALTEALKSKDWHATAKAWADAGRAYEAVLSHNEQALIEAQQLAEWDAKDARAEAGTGAEWDTPEARGQQAYNDTIQRQLGHLSWGTTPYNWLVQLVAQTDNRDSKRVLKGFCYALTGQLLGGTPDFDGQRATQAHYVQQYMPKHW